jgi:peptide/nickel transport system substrate-binding protein
MHGSGSTAPREGCASSPADASRRPGAPRRRSLALAAAGLIALAAGAAGCGAAAPSSTSTGGGGGASSATPAATATNATGGDPQSNYTTTAAKGDVPSFTWNLPYGEPTSLDPAKSYGDSENTVLANLCESLQRQNPDFSLTDGLATYKQASPTSLVYTLKPNVTFWDGKPLTAADVAYSLNRNLDTKLGSFWSAPFYNNVKSITATSDTVVTVSLKRPDALFNRMMATAAGAVGEEAYIKSKGTKYGTAKGGLMCTGPFKLGSWQAGSKVTLTRNAAYWDPQLKAKASQVVFNFITDESTSTSALTTGGLDGQFEVSPASISQLKSSGSGTLTFGAGTQFFAFRQTETKGLLSNLKIRQALSLALDRTAITKVIFGGAAVPAVTPVDPGAWGYSKATFQAAHDALPAPEYDLAKAKALVQQAGSPKGKITIAVPADLRVYTQTAQTLQSAARKIGLNITIKSLSTNVFNNLYYDKKARAAYDAFAVEEYGAGVAEPIVSLSEFTPLSAYDYGNLKDPGVTDNIRAAQGTYDDDARAALVAKAQAALVKGVGVISVASMLNSVYQGPKITGAPASLAFLYYPWAAEVGAR